MRIAFDNSQELTVFDTLVNAIKEALDKESGEDNYVSPIPKKQTFIPPCEMKNGKGNILLDI